jgi:hypothetical protein
MSCESCSYKLLLLEIKQEFPAFEVVKKRDSWLMSLIARALFCLTLGKVTNFRQDFITTIGCKVYVPDTWEVGSYIRRMIILRHERVHMRQRRRYTMPLYALLYLFLPLPGGLAYFRALFEMEAYEETIAATVELYPDGATIVRDPRQRRAMVSNFIGPWYFWMWPFRNRIEEWYDGACDRAIALRKPA